MGSASRRSGPYAGEFGELVATGRLDFILQRLSRLRSIFKLFDAGRLKGFASLQKCHDFISGIADERFEFLSLCGLRRFAKDGIKRLHQIAQPSDHTVGSFGFGQVLREGEIARCYFFEVVNSFPGSRCEYGHLEVSIVRFRNAFRRHFGNEVDCAGLSSGILSRA